MWASQYYYQSERYNLSRNDILKEIKDAEATAKVKIQQAEENKKVALAKARRTAVENIQNAEVEARSKYEKAMASEQQQLNAKKETFLAEGRKEAEALEENCASNIQKAKDYLDKEFVRTINVSS